MPTPRTRTRPARLARPLVLLAAAALLGACGTATGPGGGGGGAGGFRSLSCPDVSGATAAYYDYMNGEIRPDYPDTVRLLPYAGLPYTHPQQPLYSFLYPSGWTPNTLVDPASQLMGVNVLRNDGEALWRRLNFTLAGSVGATSVAAFERDQMLSILGVAGPVQMVCERTSPDDSFRSEVYVAGDYTANLSTQAYRMSGVTVVFVQLAFSPSGQYASDVLNVFFPLSGQMTPGGGSGDPECSDGEDNDGDGQTDYPDDPGCSSASDDSEAG